MTDPQEFARSKTSAVIAGMMVMTKMETTEEGNLSRKLATTASPDERSKMETAPLRKRASVKSVWSPWTREPPTPPSARGIHT